LQGAQSGVGAQIQAVSNKADEALLSGNDVFKYKTRLASISAVLPVGSSRIIGVATSDSGLKRSIMVARSSSGGQYFVDDSGLPLRSVYSGNQRLGHPAVHRALNLLVFPFTNVAGVLAGYIDDMDVVLNLAAPANVSAIWAHWSNSKQAVLISANNGSGNGVFSSADMLTSQYTAIQSNANAERRLTSSATTDYYFRPEAPADTALWSSTGNGAWVEHSYAGQGTLLDVMPAYDSNVVYLLFGLSGDTRLVKTTDFINYTLLGHHRGLTQSRGCWSRVSNCLYCVGHRNGYQMPFTLSEDERLVYISSNTLAPSSSQIDYVEEDFVTGKIYMAYVGTTAPNFYMVG
jgi:hypothetical protein